MKLSPPGGALASTSGTGKTVTVSSTRAAGTYTAYFFASSASAASTGTTTGMQTSCPSP